MKSDKEIPIGKAPGSTVYLELLDYQQRGISKVLKYSSEKFLKFREHNHNKEGKVRGLDKSCSHPKGHVNTDRETGAL